MILKICFKCKEEKPLNQFYKDKYKNDGYCCECIDCRKEYNKLYHIKKKFKIKNRKQSYYKNNKEKILINSKKFRQQNPDYMKQYNQVNKNILLEKASNYRKQKRKTDINFKIRNYLRTRIWQAVKKNKLNIRTLELIGCSLDELKKHLESQFKEGMSWDNYGMWHIDHIKPCAKFDLSKESEQRECFNYKNLQPLWAEENWRKGSKYKDKILEKRNTVVKN